MRRSTLLVLLSVALFSLLPLSSLSASLPGLPSEYSTTVEYNFDALGYTLSYDEYYSASLGVLRTDGRYDDRNVIELTTWPSSGGSVTMKSIDPSQLTPCTAYTLTSAQNASLLYAPSFALWQLMNYSAFVWTSQGASTMGDRQTNATYWTTPTYSLTSADVFCDNNNVCDSTGTGSYPTPPWDLLELIDPAHGYDTNSYTATFSLSVYLQTEPNGFSIPLRIYVSGTRVNLSSSSTAAVPFNNTYDFVNFKPLDRSKVLSLRQAYRSCTPTTGSTAYRAPFPSFSTVAASTYSIGDAPPASSFPNEFNMVLEGQLFNQGMGGPPMGQNNNQAARWQLDEANAQESLTFQPGFAQAATIKIFQYGDNTAYPRNGTVWTVGENIAPNNQQTGPTNITCSIAALQAWGPQNNANPLRASRAFTVGSFADFFVNVSNFDETSLSYVGQTYIRSVLANTFQGTFSGQTGFGNNTLSWTTTVYLFPSGWQFPGRDLSTDYQLPLMIVNNGTQANVGPNGNATYTFRDVWNIFELIPETDSSFFTDLPATYTCPTEVNSNGTTGGGGGGGGNGGGNGGMGGGGRPPIRLVNPPYISPEYSATVEMNFGTLGYTLSYDEYYSASQQLLRADGRYDSRAITEVTDFSAQTMTAYNSLTSSCTQYALTGSQNASLLYQPSYAILQLMNYSGIQWVQIMGGPNNVPSMIQDRNIPAIQYFVPRITILPNGTFCDVLGNCDAAGDDLSTPQWSFAELLDFATSPEGIAETGATDEPEYTTVVSFSFFFQNGSRAGLAGAIPLRVELNGTRYIDGEAIETFYNIYDWTNFRPLDTTVFSAITSSSSYGSCTTSSSSYRAPFPNATSVEQTTIAIGSAPLSTSFPSQFVMQVEGLVAQFSLNQRNGPGGGPGNGGDMGGPQIGNSVTNYAAKWSYDSAGDQESISTYADNFTLAVNPTIYIYEYGTTYNGGGEVWQVDGSASTGYTCVDAELTDYVENPLQSERGGVISFTQLFTNSSYDLSNFQYRGRALQRGVPADWYQANFSNIYSTDTSYYGSLVFNYSANIYMYPSGWVFPGRANAADLQLPFRVVFQGLQRNLSSTNQTASVFVDNYNLFEFYPASDIMAVASGSTLVSSTWFADTPSTYGCPGYSSSSNSSSSGLSGGAIAGIVIAVLVALAVALVLIVLCRRGNWGSGKKLFNGKSSSGSEGVTVAGAGGSGKWKRQDEDFEPSTSRNDVELESTV